MKTLVVPLVQLRLPCTFLCCSQRPLTGWCPRRWTTHPDICLQHCFWIHYHRIQNLTSLKAYMLTRVGEIYYCYCQDGQGSKTHILKSTLVQNSLLPWTTTPDHRKSGEEHGINQIPAPKPAAIFPHLSVILVRMHISQPVPRMWETECTSFDC